MIKRFCDVCGRVLRDESSATIYVSKRGHSIVDSSDRLYEDICPRCVKKVKELLNDIECKAKGQDSPVAPV